MSDAGTPERVEEIAFAPELLLQLCRHHPERYPFLLESAADGTPQGRYDILFACPGDALELDADFALRGPGTGAGHDFLAALNGWWQHEHVELPPGDLPFRGGWFLFLGYELAAQVEPTLRLEAAPDRPVALAVRVPTAVITDRATSRAWLISEASAADCHRIVADDIAALTDRSGGSGPAAGILRGPMTEEDPQIYVDAIRRTLRYIVDGDVFQANLSRTWRGRVQAECGPLDVYRRLRRSNPGPFAGLMTWRGYAVISSSPERLLQIRAGRVQTRPIAGTRPRGRNKRTDRSLSRELLGHPKERAEHVMLIDLERNDLGRICVPGTVEVDELMVIESYAHVHHIVSNVRGTLRPDVLPGDAIRAVFPGGTITGCPKVRCMEIIDELEPDPRSAYTGSMGYLNRDGSLDINILIRTLQMQHGWLSCRAGGGIVADSDPSAELEETRAKARGMLVALEGQNP